MQVGTGDTGQPPRPGEKPHVLQLKIEGVPAALRDLPQWVCWRHTLRNGKWTKAPVSARTGNLASSTNPATWTTFEDTLAYYEDNKSTLSGIGFVFSPDDPFAGVDLDDALAPDGQPKQWAQQLIGMLTSYAEISPSGTGVKVYVRGHRPGNRSRKQYRDGEVEIYDRARFFAITGQHLAGTPTTIEDRQEELESAYRIVFGENASPPQPLPTSNGHLTDADVLRIAFHASNGQRIRALYDGDISAHGDDHSRADSALCCHLAFFCQGDRAQIDRLFRGSRLMRPKWDERRGEKTYGQRTIARALETVTEYYQPRQRNSPSANGHHGNGNGQANSGRPDHDPEEPSHLTDRGNAIRLVQQYGDVLRHCFPWRKWLVWDGTRWRQDDTGEVTRCIKRMVLRLFTAAIAEVNVVKQELESLPEET